MARKKSDDDTMSAADASVASLAEHKRKKHVPPSRKGIPATEKQKAALKRGAQKSKDKAKARREREAQEGKSKSRWHQLLDGDIDVADLDMDELKRMQTRDAIGEFGGRPPTVPARLARAMKAELLMRGQAMIDSAYPEAIALLSEVVRDRKAKHSDRIKAAQLIVERSAGRMPETVRVEKAQTWDETFEDGVIVINNDKSEAG